MLAQLGATTRPRTRELYRRLIDRTPVSVLGAVERVVLLALVDTRMAGPQLRDTVITMRQLTGYIHGRDNDARAQEFAADNHASWGWTHSRVERAIAQLVAGGWLTIRDIALNDLEDPSFPRCGAQINSYRYQVPPVVRLRWNQIVRASEGAADRAGGGQRTKARPTTTPHVDVIDDLDLVDDVDAPDWAFPVDDLDGAAVEGPSAALSGPEQPPAAPTAPSSRREPTSSVQASLPRCPGVSPAVMTRIIGLIATGRRRGHPDTQIKAALTADGVPLDAIVVAFAHHDHQRAGP